MELERVVRVLEERKEGLRILRESSLSFVFGFCVFFLCLVSKHKKILLNGFV